MQGVANQLFAQKGRNSVSIINNTNIEIRNRTPRRGQIDVRLRPINNMVTPKSIKAKPFSIDMSA